MSAGPDAARRNGSMSIGELAEATGVSQRTIRYYEELGILPEPPRSPGGTRRYPADYRFYVEGALALKEVGFTLEELQLVGRFALDVKMSRSERDKAHAIIEQHMQLLEHKIRVLQRVRAVLQTGERPSGDQAARRLVELVEAADA